MEQCYYRRVKKRIDEAISADSLGSISKGTALIGQYLPGVNVEACSLDEWALHFEKALYLEKRSGLVMANAVAKATLMAMAAMMSKRT